MNLFAIDTNGKSYKRYSRKFDKDFNLLEIEQFNPDSNLADKYSFSYDNSRQLTESRQYDSKRNVVKLIKYTYDDNGSEVGYTVYDGANRLLDEYVFTYSDHDETGNWRKRNCYKTISPCHYSAYTCLLRLAICIEKMRRASRNLRLFVEHCLKVKGPRCLLTMAMEQSVRRNSCWHNSYSLVTNNSFTS